MSGADIQSVLPMSGTDIQYGGTTRVLGTDMQYLPALPMLLADKAYGATPCPVLTYGVCSYQAVPPSLLPPLLALSLSDSPTLSFQRPGTNCTPISLRASYALSGTDEAYAGISLRVMPGTDLGHWVCCYARATQCPVLT
eukprot:2817356-Rhodomonas_salina.4